jgi:chemotaxis signal transduction protein/HPt (histidine-containing phosphotransfer) domain-containing protein
VADYNLRRNTAVGEFDDLIEEFVTESREHIADIEEDLIKIESDMENIDHEVINRLFRAAHSIKGSAKFLDLINIGELAHKMEDVLNLIRSGKLIPTSEISNPLLQAADMLKNMFEDVMASNNMDISENIEQLQKILDGEASSAAPKTKKKRDALSPDVLSVFDIDRQSVLKKLETSQVYVLNVKYKKTKYDKFINEIINLGEIIATQESEQDGAFILFSSIIESDMIPMALEIDSSLVKQIHAELFENIDGKPITQTGREEVSRPNKNIPELQPQAQESHLEEKIVSAETKVAKQQSSPVQQEKIILMQEAEMKTKQDNTSFITFSLEKETYAVPIQAIEEIIGLQDISLLPNVPDFIKGVINLRGELVPIMDLRLKLGLDQKEYNPLTVFLIVRVTDRVMGLVVDNVADVLVIDHKRVQKTPSFSAQISTDFIEGVYKDPQEQMVILVDIPSLIKPEEWDLGQASTSFLM